MQARESQIPRFLQALYTRVQDTLRDESASEKSPAEKLPQFALGHTLVKRQIKELGPTEWPRGSHHILIKRKYARKEL